MTGWHGAMVLVLDDLVDAYSTFHNVDDDMQSSSQAASYYVHWRSDLDLGVVSTPPDE